MTDDDEPRRPELLLPKEGALPPNVYADIAAQINQYTDRPDLLLETIERHDPGFIKTVNDEAKAFQRIFRLSRFRFGRFQAYTALSISVLAAVAIFGIIAYLAFLGKLTVWMIVAFAIFYAVTQSGIGGFLKIAQHLAELLKSFGGKGGPTS
ncbi:hypothetical protein [Jiella flava]|uniref:Uncharacterized protein n=1 Tax=Jiella flava TaxID=2816857 RepID=A0A939G2S7_9HYPH|nr:hypothetical protein [Jiella flava]MBO0664172.1 hypothetical protein [Jiella flava]